MKNRIIQKYHPRKITKVIISLYSFSAVTTLFFSAPSGSFAQSLGDRIQNIQRADDPNDFIAQLIGIATVLAAMSLVALGIYAGYIMITSQGNPEKINEAREILTNAVIGFALITLSVAILLIITEVLGLSSIL